MAAVAHVASKNERHGSRSSKDILSNVKLTIESTRMAKGNKRVLPVALLVDSIVYFTLLFIFV